MRPAAAGYLDYAPPPRRVSGLITAALGAVVFTLHCIIQFVLYRGRIVGRWSLADSDAIVFLMPNFLALAAYAFLLGRWVAAKDWPVGAKVAAAIALTLVATFFSFWGSMLVPINVYGT
jgi:hypothetical protein